MSGEDIHGIEMEMDQERGGGIEMDMDQERGGGIEMDQERGGK